MATVQLGIRSSCTTCLKAMQMGSPTSSSRFPIHVAKRTMSTNKLTTYPRTFPTSGFTVVDKSTPIEEETLPRLQA